MSLPCWTSAEQAIVCRKREDVRASVQFALIENNDVGSSRFLFYFIMLMLQKAAWPFSLHLEEDLAVCCVYLAVHAHTRFDLPSLALKWYS